MLPTQVKLVNYYYIRKLAYEKYSQVNKYFNQIIQDSCNHITANELFVFVTIMFGDKMSYASL